jgi:peptidoglycan/xylan/chitin deacetylase (PgdA/CDA1 family)
MTLSGKKAFRLLSSFTGMIPLETLKRITGQRTVFPFYHLVSDEEVPHVKFLYRTKTVKEFTSDLEFLLKHYKPIGVGDLISSLKSGRQLPANSFMLSFDDGLKEFHDVVAPVLLKKGIPATCFLNSGFIDNKDLFYRYKASLLIGRLGELNASGCRQEEIGTWFWEHHFPGGINPNNLLKISYGNRFLLNDLGGLLEFDFKEYLRKYSPYLDSEQVNSLIKQGFSFGAHSIDHPEYRLIPEHEQVLQTVESVRVLRQMFGLPFNLFAFPFTDFGIGRSFFDKVFDPADPAVDLTFGGAGLKKDSIRQNIQRIPFERERLGAGQILTTEYIYYIIKSIFGKNLIRR